MMTGIVWTRVILAAIASEVGVIVVLLVAIAAYKRVLEPSGRTVDNRALGERLGYYIAPGAGAMTTFAMATWAARGADSRYLAHGLWVGALSVLLALGFAITGRREHRFMYGVAFTLRIVAGALGGLVAQ